MHFSRETVRRTIVQATRKSVQQQIVKKFSFFVVIRVLNSSRIVDETAVPGCAKCKTSNYHTKMRKADEMTIDYGSKCSIIMGCLSFKWGTPHQETFAIFSLLLFKLFIQIKMASCWWLNLISDVEHLQTNKMHTRILSHTYYGANGY